MLRYSTYLKTIMKYSRNWLHQQLASHLAVDDFIERLKKASLIIELLPVSSFDFSGVIVGEIISIAPHPNADKLQLCQVNVGGDELLSIVCGAKNIYPKMKIPVAVIGSVLPGDFTIKKAKLRGEVSYGMLCSAKELNLSEESHGILTLPQDAPVGILAHQYLQLDEEIVQLIDSKSKFNDLSVLELANHIDFSSDKHNKSCLFSKLKKLLKVVFRL